MVGGTNYFYTLRIYSDPTVPTATISYPVNRVKLPNGPVDIRVNATDNPGGSGMSHVAIFWHNQDWNTGKWTKVGEDWNGTDGWNVVFDTSHEAYGTGGAIYAQVFDGSGNWTSALPALTAKQTNRFHLQHLHPCMYPSRRNRH